VQHPGQFDRDIAAAGDGDARRAGVQLEKAVRGDAEFGAGQFGNLRAAFFKRRQLFSSFQISALYSAMVRSVENLPLPAVLRMLIRVQFSLVLIGPATRLGVDEGAEIGATSQGSWGWDGLDDGLENTLLELVEVAGFPAIASPVSGPVASMRATGS
jgi:hypothetical protein